MGLGIARLQKAGTPPIAKPNFTASSVYGGMVRFVSDGRPTDNAFIEAFNGRLRQECLNTHWFLTLDDAREKLEAWRRDYNEVRPQGAIGNKPPMALINCDQAGSPPSQ